MNDIAFNTVRIACQSLTDDELAAINNVAQAGMDPRKVEGYEKVSHLFTENGGTAMHPETRKALASIVLQRLAPPQARPKPVLTIIDVADPPEVWKSTELRQDQPRAGQIENDTIDRDDDNASWRSTEPPQDKKKASWCSVEPQRDKKSLLMQC